MLFFNIVWWLFFTICGLFIQGFVPGIDALAPGLVISLQEGRWQQTLWLCLAFVLVQEGTGSLSFGAAPLWYLGVMLLFLLGCRLFMASNFLFVVLLSLALGCLHFLVVLLVSRIESYVYSPEMLIEGSVIQAIAFPVIWVTFSFIRRRCFRNAARG